jgi:hypothetical protein
MLCSLACSILYIFTAAYDFGHFFFSVRQGYAIKVSPQGYLTVAKNVQNYCTNPCITFTEQDAAILTQCVSYFDTRCPCVTVGRIQNTAD